MSKKKKAFISLNVSQTETLRDFLINMSVAWFAGAFITRTNFYELIQFSTMGIIAFITAMILMKGVKKI